ncbi:ABC transporter ATP-binding protein [Legionella hackeliae]|uniref:ABC transporter, ATP binding protein n=1 Tax=Legionella hackeliae TaxID=449 RepID=A0A0A8UUC1_LEGHA|nr:ABC transporter ATP-binding protein [Legionella hackeliae]KTD14174.1 ABC transporter ATP-binding protein [Legionella hackeliae]CEK10384.1 ABC transporter, ATP binding protein [Legionella hackeliae]STX47119.1 ABC transporter ATP-binding protein [Legionella hackeliae]
MTNKKHQSVTQFIVSLLKPYKFYLTIFAFVALFWAITNTLLPYLLKVIIDEAVNSQGDKLSAFAIMKPYIFLYVALWIGLCLDMRLLDWVKLKLFPGLRQDVMSKMFAYLNLHSHHYFQNNFAGSLINKIVDMQGGIIDILTIVDDVYAQSLGLIIAIGTLLFIHPLFAFTLLAWVATFLLITFLFLRPIENLSHVFAEARSSLVGRMVDSISNIVNVRLFASHRFENEFINKSIVDAVQKDRKMQAKIIHMRMWWDLSIVVLLGVNLWMLGRMYSQDLVTVGDFSFIITLSISILWNLWFIAGQFVSFSEQVGKCRQALSIINASHDITDADDAKPLVITQGEIQFKEVSFHYEEGARLFKNKTILIHPGQKVGLVGFSGSGKSTFVNLMLRLYDVESGTITIDNQPINKVTQESLRQNIALIPQDISLFHRTLMENIRYGSSNASDEEVIEASKKAHCHEFISQLNDGYQSMVGERGIKLSGGQRQRIAIARAILKNAPILILDEATSALDSVTEKYIQDALHNLMQGKTTIVIAHRLSTLSEMDRILVFDNGQIIEDATQEQLIKLNGHYTKMWEMQAGGFLPEHLKVQ